MNKTSPQLSIIITAYNEEDIIGKAIEEVRKELPDAEILVVDDGSTDGTLDAARRYENDLVRVIASGENRGKGHAIRTGIDAARGEIMAQIDADLQFPPSGFPTLFQPIFEDNADIVFATRYDQGAKLEEGSVSGIKYLASYVMGWLITIITGQRFTDVFAGFKAWKTNVIRHLDIKEDDFTYEAEIAIKGIRNGYRIVEVPTNYHKRVSGSSKIRVVYHTLKISWQIFLIALTARPKPKDNH